MTEQHWHRRDKGDTDSTGLRVYGCTHDGCTWTVFIHPGGRADYSEPTEKPLDRTRRLHAANKEAHDARRAIYQM